MTLMSNVTASGGVFYPLVVESFGTWSVHSLEVLKTIARKTSLSQTLTISRAVCNLHELLSIRLWQYNARMILDRLHLSFKGLLFRLEIPIYIYKQRGLIESVVIWLMV